MRRLPTAGDLSGSLLVAHPMMADPNFRRCILYLSHHSSESGALGFILNRPLGKTLRDLHIAERNDAVAHSPLYEGGPVERNQLIVANLEWDETLGTCRFDPIDKPKNPSHLLQQNKNLRIFLGYAGWEKNQLEKEIAHNSWIIIHPHPELLRADVNDSTWRNVMLSLGPIYRILADAPLKPTQN